MTSTLHIQTALVDNKTMLKRGYCTTPFKIANITEDKNGKTLQLMLMSSSPGILDGDAYHIKIDLGENSSLQLFTQSYQRLFQMCRGASQQMDIHLEVGATLYYIPHPVVPHRKSDFKVSSNIFLSNDCSLVLGEIITCGRVINNEIFKFTRYHSVTKIYINNKLVIKENLLLEPLIKDVTVMGQWENYTHQASLIYLNEKAEVKILAKNVNDLLQAEEGITYGISLAPVNGLIIRILGRKAEQLYNCLQLVGAILPMIKTENTVIYAI